MTPSSQKTRLLFTLLSSVCFSTVASDALAAGPGFAPGPPGWNYYSSQNLLIGATLSLQQSVNYASGITVATIDTGVESSWVGFGGLTISSHSCRNGTCGTASPDSDDNGHGTFVASEIIGGVQFSNGNGMVGVAPFANLVSVKVLDANGSGNDADVAKGIRYAADQGAKIINLSLGPSGNFTQQIAFYNGLASAINYAATKNAVLVFAGGNDAQVFVNKFNIGDSKPPASNPNQFTDAAIKHMLFVGATDSKKLLTTYSNTPGTGGFFSATGKYYGFNKMWVMADGGGVAAGQCVDCIVGAPNLPNANYLALNAGTSMAAPQATGAAALLAARWPVLISQGTIPALIAQTATDLGVKGIDKTYGSGFIDLVKAFQPVGTLSVTTPGGSSVPVSGGSSILSGGALGAMSHLGTALSNYTAFDSFQRDFEVDLASGIATRPSSGRAAQSVAAPAVSARTVHFTNGSALAYGNMEKDPWQMAQPAAASPNANWFVSFTDDAGSTVAAGMGFPASASFAGAMWGTDSPAASAASSLGVSDALLSLAQGGTFVAFGSKLGGDTRVALSWSDSQTVNNPIASDWTQANATSVSTGITHRLTEAWSAGLTFGVLNEQNGLLGTTYAESSPVNLGDRHHSTSVGMSSSLDLGDKRSLLVDAAIARTGGAQAFGSLISGITPLYARSFGASLLQRDAVKKGDNLSLSLRAPLRVFSGSAGLASTSVDADGVATTITRNVSLVPTGHEMNLSLGYAAPLSTNMSWNLAVDARRDVNNISGLNDVGFLVGTRLSF